MTRLNQPDQAAIDTLAAQAPESGKSSPSLPYDIIYRIIDAAAEPAIDSTGFVEYDVDVSPPRPPYQLLCNLALTGRHLLPSARRVLYRSIHLISSQAFYALCQTIHSNGAFGTLIRHLSILDAVVYRAEVLGVHVEQVWRFLHKCRSLQSVYFQYSNVHTMRYIRGALPVLDIPAAGIYRGHIELTGEISFQPLPQGWKWNKRLSNSVSLTMHAPQTQIGVDCIQFMEGHDMLFAAPLTFDLPLLYLPKLTQLYLDSCLASKGIGALLQLLAPRLHTLAIREKVSQQFPDMRAVLACATTLQSLSLGKLELEAEIFTHLSPSIVTLRLSECTLAEPACSALTRALANLPRLECIMLNIKTEYSEHAEREEPVPWLPAYRSTYAIQTQQRKLENNRMALKEVRRLREVCEQRDIRLHGTWSLLQAEV